MGSKADIFPEKKESLIGGVSINCVYLFNAETSNMMVSNSNAELSVF